MKVIKTIARVQVVMFLNESGQLCSAVDVNATNITGTEFEALKRLVSDLPARLDEHVEVVGPVNRLLS